MAENDIVIMKEGAAGVWQRVVVAPAALTAADANAVNSGDPTTDGVINNIRTRLGEVEAQLQSLNILT